MAITEEDVLAVCETAKTEDEVTPFLDAAKAMVADRIPADAYSAATRNLITVHTAALLISMVDPLLTSEGLDGTSRSFHIPTGAGLEAYPSGRIVKMLDIRGYMTLGTTSSILTAGMPRTAEEVQRFWENEGQSRLE